MEKKFTVWFKILILTVSLSLVLDCFLLPWGLPNIFEIAQILLKCYLLPNSSRAILNKVALEMNNLG